ncbi:hypothetical protein TNCV_1085741 [Trichonephila clavipes]|nr:hypothetical protein TNCV_1085741 [Trichonephila clavipes]
MSSQSRTGAQKCAGVPSLSLSHAGTKVSVLPLMEENIRHKNWSSSSPYLNPNEHIWDGLGKDVSQPSAPPLRSQKSCF